MITTELKTRLAEELTGRGVKESADEYIAVQIAEFNTFTDEDLNRVLLCGETEAIMEVVTTLVKDEQERREHGR